MTGERGYPFIDFMFVADRAEALNGKLYIMGGCWDRIQVGALPGMHPMGIALVAVVPAGDGLQDHVIEFTLEGPGEPQLTVRGTAFRQQGPAPRDEPERAIMGLNTMATFTAPGRYTLTATLDQGNREQVQFEVAVTAA